MRLIDTKTLKLTEWAGSAPAYAILSHCWGDEEISFAEFNSPVASTSHKAGWEKIESCAAQARLDGHAYLWIDTCCIDKSSSAELSEAINSMYRWYADAILCYVYLADVPYQGAFTANMSFKRSKWHTRGWTLQELLAPKEIHFYSAEWSRLDTSVPLTVVRQHISEATGIGIDVLEGKIAVQSTPVAKRMSWASGRQTTRTEDMAYCLLGIFDVNMPMLYGEGPKAFRRLQEEIMKTSLDQTLFVWRHVDDDPEQTGLLAPHPRNFQHSGNFEDKSQLEGLQFASEYQAYREGISLNVYLDPLVSSPAVGTSATASTQSTTTNIGLAQSPEISTAILTCAEDHDPNSFAAIQVVKLDSQYMRHKGIKLIRTRLIGTPKSIFVRHHPPALMTRKLKQQYIHMTFETNCPNASIFAMPSKTKIPPPEYLTQKIRDSYKSQLISQNETLAAEIATNYAGRTLESVTTHGVHLPLKKLSSSKRETFSPSEFELGYDVPLQDLKWPLPLLPNTLMAYLRIVPGIYKSDIRGEPRGISVGVDDRAALGFVVAKNRPGLNRVPLKFKGYYTLYFNYRDTKADDEDEGVVAEVKLSLKHSPERDYRDAEQILDRGAADQTWELGPDGVPEGDECPCVKRLLES